MLDLTAAIFETILKGFFLSFRDKCNEKIFVRRKFCSSVTDVQKWEIRHTVYTIGMKILKFLMHLFVYICKLFY